MNLKTEILDCTIRDGGYVNNWAFDKKMVREVYRAVSKSGIDYVELGYYGVKSDQDRCGAGMWYHADDKALLEATTGIKGSKIAVMVDYGKVQLADFGYADQSVVDLVRMAAHKNHIDEALEMLKGLRDKGYMVSLNAMGFTSFSGEETAELVARLSSAELDYFYIVDSYGSMFPHQIGEILNPFLEIGSMKVGFHPHNSLQMAFANTIEAINCGIHIIDSTIYGMGRGAGNLPTEAIVAYLQMSNEEKYNVLPILNCIHNFFIDIEQEHKWGYQLPYMLSGMFQCHPNYAKTLVDMREYSVEDMWKAMDVIKKRKTIGFSKEALDDVMNSGLIGRNQPNGNEAIENESDGGAGGCGKKAEVSYLNRHTGRDFLVLANGPTLKAYQEPIRRFIEKYNPVVLGANYLGDLFVPDYHAFNNKKRFIMYSDSVAPESKLLIGEHLPESLIREYVDRSYESLRYLDRTSAPFGIVDGVIQANCRTISILLLGVAIVMGASRVFAAGMDGYIGTDSSGSFHFYKEKDDKSDQEMIISQHQWCENFIAQIDQHLVSNGSEGIHILTPTSYKGFYKGIDNYL